MDLEELDRRRFYQAIEEYRDRIVAAPIHPSVIRAGIESCEAAIAYRKDLLEAATEEQKPDLLIEIERYEAGLAKCEAELAALPSESEPAPNREIEPPPEKVPTPAIPALVEDINDSKASDPRNESSSEKCAAWFHKQGEIWMLSFRGKTVHISHLVGLNYIVELLRKPGIPIEAVVLIGANLGSKNVVTSSGILQADEKTLKAVHAELSKKRTELTGFPNNNWANKGALKEEIYKLEEYLAKSETHRGRSRKIAGTAERTFICGEK